MVFLMKDVDLLTIAGGFCCFCLFVWLFVCLNSLLASMNGHEHYEEAKLYPFLCWKYSVGLKFLEREHEQLHEEADKVVNAAEELVGQSNPTAEEFANLKSRLVAACFGYDKLLRRHLLEEEDCVIPLLLELTPQEFEQYYNASTYEVSRWIKQGRN